MAPNPKQTNKPPTNDFLNKAPIFLQLISEYKEILISSYKFRTKFRLIFRTNP